MCTYPSKMRNVLGQLMYSWYMSRQIVMGHMIGDCVVFSLHIQPYQATTSVQSCQAPDTSPSQLFRQSIYHYCTAIEPPEMSATVRRPLQFSIYYPVDLFTLLTIIPALRRPQARLGQNLHLTRTERPNSNSPPSLQEAQR